MSKSSFKSTPDDPKPKNNDSNSLKPAEDANVAAPEASEKELARFRWSFLIWVAAVVFIWAILLLEGLRVLFDTIRRTFTGS
jgi:hypothetical protein